MTVKERNNSINWDLLILAIIFNFQFSIYCIVYWEVKIMAIVNTAVPVTSARSEKYLEEIVKATGNRYKVY